MNALRSPWVIAILALALSLGTMVVTVYLGLKAMIPEPVVDQSHLTDERDLKVWRFDSRAMEELVRELKKRKEDLDRREEQVREIEARVLNERAELDKVRGVIEGQQAKIKTYVIEYTAAEKENFQRNVKIHSALSPQALIAVFSQMKDEDVARYLALMKNDVITDLFEAMVKTDTGDSAQVRRVAILSDMLRRLHDAAVPEVEPTSVAAAPKPPAASPGAPPTAARPGPATAATPPPASR